MSRRVREGGSGLPTDSPAGLLVRLPAFSATGLLRAGPTTGDCASGSRDSAPEYLTNIHKPGETIQRLISSCPRLADLTLEECRTWSQVSVLDKRLRRLAFRCCHNAVHVTLDASELTKLEYRGGVPAESLLTLHGSPRIASTTIDLCGQQALSTKEQLSGFRKLLGNFVDAKRLHLQNIGWVAASGVSSLLVSHCSRTCGT